MIQNRAEYKAYLEADLKAHNFKKWSFIYRFVCPQLYYQRALRKYEYYLNCKKEIIFKPFLYIAALRYYLLSAKLGLQIPPNVCGPGLSIAHFGSIIISDKSVIGKNLRIHSCTNIGINKGKAPIIGDNVFIAPGAKLYGDITVGDNSKIGANSVVNKNVPNNVTVAGVPAKVISECQAAWNATDK